MIKCNSSCVILLKSSQIYNIWLLFSSKMIYKGNRYIDINEQIKATTIYLSNFSSSISMCMFG